MNERRDKPLDLDTTVFEKLALKPLAEELQRDEAFERHGKSAHTLARGNGMTSVLTVVRAGTEIGEHSAPGPVTIVVISGRITLRSGSGEVDAGEGCAVTFSAGVPHSVRADETSTFLIVIGGKL